MGNKQLWNHIGNTREILKIGEKNFIIIIIIIIIIMTYNQVQPLRINYLAS